MKLIDQYQDIELIDALEERYLAYALTTIMDREHFQIQGMG